MRLPTSLRVQWLLAFAGFFLAMAAWSFAAPFDGTMDERQHLIRAAGAASGTMVGEEYSYGLLQRVPVEYTPENCWIHHASAACAPPLTRGPKVMATSAAGRYFPLYYIVVGWPLNVWGGWTGLYLARLISAALSAAFLASAFVVLARWSRYGLMLGGLVVAASPMVVELGGAVNPNGLEISAGIALFAAGIPLMFGPARGSPTPLYWLMAISAATLATLKATGPLWLAVIAFVLLVPTRRERLRELLRPPLVKLLLAGVAVTSAVAVAWTVVVKAHQILPYEQPPLSLSQAAFMELERWVKWDGGYLHQLVGLMSWLDTRMLEIAYPVWWFTAAALIVPALLFGNRLDRWRLAVLILGATGIPFVMQVLGANEMGFVTQARYFLPMLVGVPMLAAFVLERRVLDAAQCRTFTRFTVLALLPIQFIALLFTIERWQNGPLFQRGLGTLNVLTGEWHPPGGSVLPLLLMVAGLVVQGILLWRAPDRAAAEFDEPDRTPPSAVVVPRQRVEPELRSTVTPSP